MSCIAFMAAIGHGLLKSRPYVGSVILNYLRKLSTRDAIEKPTHFAYASTASLCLLDDFSYSIIEELFKILNRFKL